MKGRFPAIRTIIEENPFLSQKKIFQTLSLHHDVMKRLITEELSLWRVNSKWVPHTLTTSPKMERVKISLKLFRQRNKLHVNDVACVITRMKSGSTLKIRDPQHGSVLA
jgi:hypothetical protein